MNAPRPDVVDILVENHRRFAAFVESRVGNVVDAEDILQAAFVKGVEKSETVRDDDSVVAWFYRLLRNALSDYYRNRAAERIALRRVDGLSASAEEPEPEIERAVCQCVIALLPTLRESYADIIRRVDLEGVSVADVAAETGLTPNNVRVRVHRARQALRRQLELSCGTCTEHRCLDCTCKDKRSSHRST